MPIKIRLFIQDTQDGEYQWLVGQGYSGSLNDMIFKYLGDQGKTGSLVDRLLSYHSGPTGPTNTVAPVVSGTTTVGQTLSCTTGTWTGEGTITYAYQWRDDGVNISGATSSTYVLQAAEEGGNITCVVTATDDNGSTPATSNSVGPVVAASGPSLDLNFASGTYTDGTNTLLSDIATFTRSGNATMIDSTGTVVWAPHNLITNSEAFSSWTNQATTITDDAATDPDGGSTADKLIPTAVSDRHYRYKTQTDLPRLSNSVFVKAAGYDYAFVCLSNTSSDYYAVVVNLTDGSVSANYSSGTHTAKSHSVVDAGSGWYQVTISGDHEDFFLVGAVDTGTYTPGAFGAKSFTGDGTSGIYAWGGHIYRSDLGGMADNPERSDSYVPTTTAAVYMPRENHYEYNGAAWVNDGILYEPTGATNLVANSEDFTTFTVAAGAVTADQITSPDGTTNADLLDANGSTSTRISVSYTFSSSTTYTASLFAKAGTASSVAIGAWTNSSAKQVAAEFNLATGAFTSQSTASDITFVRAVITDAGNGWYRCAVVFTASPTSAGGSVQIGIQENGTGGFTSGTTDTVYLWGAQLEVGDYPSSYIPTTGATATRAAETLVINAASMPESATGQSIVIKHKSSYIDDGANHLARGILKWGSTNFIRLGFGTAASWTGYPIAEMQNGASLSRANYNSTTDVYSPGYRVAMHFGVRCNSTGYIEVVADGSTLSAPQTVSGAYPTLTGETMELFTHGTTDMNGTIQRIRVWDNDIGQADLLTETT